ncbi:MAG: hypothetical protein ABEI76_08515 [Halobacteriales archaeon]
MKSPQPDATRLSSLRSRAYRIHLDDRRESFCALCIEDENTENAWLMSDTVRALDNYR